VVIFDETIHRADHGLLPALVALGAAVAGVVILALAQPKPD